jgi:hypothetical protein
MGATAGQEASEKIKPGVRNILRYTLLYPPHNEDRLWNRFVKPLHLHHTANPANAVPKYSNFRAG